MAYVRAPTKIRAELGFPRKPANVHARSAVQQGPGFQTTPAGDASPSTASTPLTDPLPRGCLRDPPQLPSSGPPSMTAAPPAARPAPARRDSHLPGDLSDADRLLSVLGYERDDLDRASQIYNQLRQIARAHRVRWGGDATVCTTALVHEAYLKLSRSTLRFQSRAHFMATSSRAMRQVLVTYAEARCAQKRGGGERHLSLDEAQLGGIGAHDAAEIAAVDESLRRLARWDERGARVVECRFFAGLTVDETAEALGLSPATVRRIWQKVRTWLYLDLHPAT